MAAPRPMANDAPRALASDHSRVARNDARLSKLDGFIADNERISPFDSSHPAIANLDPALRQAVQEAARDAAADGITMEVSAGWRSERYQQVLLDEARKKYGSLAEAMRWVNPPDESTHVSGGAVDILPSDADSWLSRHGSDYGLCQTYANERWHFELAVEPGGVCPRMMQDAASD